MAKKGNLTKALAIAGTVLVWFPIFATIVTSVFGSLRSGMFRFDYLMPAELFPVAFIGGGLLLWAALRAQMRQKLIGWGLASIVVLRVGGQAIAVASGLASGETEPVGWILVVAIASIVLYTLTLIEIGIAGVLLTRDLFKQNKNASGAQ